MTVLSYSFVLFFLASAAAYFAAPRKLKPGVLLATSLVFYGWSHPGFVALLVGEALPLTVSPGGLKKMTGPAGGLP